MQSTPQNAEHSRRNVLSFKKQKMQKVIHNVGIRMREYSNAIADENIK